MAEYGNKVNNIELAKKIFRSHENQKNNLKQKKEDKETSLLCLDC
jgi:hypothetical protein